MKQRLLMLFGLFTMFSGYLFAQKPAVDTYRITVVTRTGERTQGILGDVTATDVYCDPGDLYSSIYDAKVIPLETIRKVILRRTNKRLAVQAGALAGGLLFGFLTMQGLEKNPTRNAITYSITLVLGTGAGVAIGAGTGAVLGNLSHRVIRPRDRENSLDDFRRQLEPFSARYQNDVFNRIYQ